MAKKATKPKNQKLAAAMIGNQNALGNNGGVEPFYHSPEEMLPKVASYFEWAQGEQETIQTEAGPKQVYSRAPEPLTITGLALYLGFASRQSLEDYEKKPEFSYIIKNARLRVENGYEKCLFTRNATGAIFALKNMGWKDKQEVDHTTAGESFHLQDMVRFEE
jgi:hypothetical protein